jgi:signal transduction histidine kinase
MKHFTARTGILTRLTAFAGVERLDATLRTVLFRVAQEALTNVDRHAQASRVDVSIRHLPDCICMQIIDDGKSFDVDRAFNSTGGGRLGLLGMRERVEMVGGKLLIESARGKGTSVQARISPANLPPGAEDRD